MRQFLKFMFASMLGTFLIGGVLILLFVGALTAAIGSSMSFDSGKKVTVKDNTVMLLKLDQEIVDRGSKEDLQIDFGPFKSMKKLGLDQILDNLERAKTDDKIKGIFLDLTVIPAGFATMEEIHDAITEFKAESGKWVIAYSEWYTLGSYYIASTADEVYVQPKGDVDFRGLRSENMYLKNMFNKLDIEVQLIRGSNNKYKSFGETFVKEEMSPEAEKQTRELLTSLWNDYLDAVGKHRNLDRSRLNSIAEEMLVRKAEDAVEVGLIDGVKYRDEVLDMMRGKLGIDMDDDIETLAFSDYTHAKKKDKSVFSTKSKIGVVYAEGSIASGKSEDGVIGSETLAKAISEARRDSSIEAIVLRVNSPGGSGLASDVIWREVELAKQTKPVVVSMGNLAASGGYYISCAANKIYADPTTITGSIGVFGIIPNMQGFFNNKLGINFDGVKTNEYADMMTTTRALTAEEKGIIQKYIDEFYDTFITRVAEGRGMSKADVDSVGQGRVWTGRDALKIGLVDELGGLEDAIAHAAEMAGLEEYKTVGYPEQKGMMEQLMEDFGGGAHAWMREQIMGDDLELIEQFEKVKNVKRMSGIMARMPYDIEIH